MATAPTITSNGGGDTATVFVPENTLSITTVTASDPDPGTILSYSIIGGPDQFRLTINGSTGALSFFDPIYTNFEAPADSGNDGQYIVQVKASDGSLSDTQTITVILTDVNEAPRFTSGGFEGAGSLVSFPLFENSTSLGRLVGGDPDANTILTYSIVGGADAGKFSINAATGLMNFITPPDFENPTDADGNNSYIVQVRVSDGQLFSDQTIIFNIDNRNEAPVFVSPSTITVPENTAFVTQVVAVDQDAGTSLSYSISGGSSTFQIDANTGVLSFITPPDFDTSFSHSFSLFVSASDGVNFPVTQFITVNVTNVNDVPPIINSDGGGETATVSIVENTTAVTTVTASDLEAGTTVAYSIGGGADAALFQINSATGALSFKTAPNFEQPADADHNNTYIVQVTASNGALSDSQTLTINVTDVLEIPHCIGSSDLGTHPTGYAPVSTADFNHDFTNDVLWFNSSNLDVDLWKISNAKWAGSVDIGAHPAGYTLTATGDFNHDATPDLLWYNPANGDVDIWKISNGQWAGSASAGTHPLGAQPLGSGDFNGDGTSDVVWYNSSNNDAEVWLMQNGQWAASVDLGSHPAGYRPIASTDIDRDGTSDLVWYNATTNDVDVWRIVNGHWAASTDIGAHPAGYAPAGLGDFNGDGSPDMVWFNATTGDVDIWLLQNGHWAGSVDLGAHPAGWAPAGPGDFNHDGHPDLLWREAATNHVEAWLLSNS